MSLLRLIDFGLSERFYAVREGHLHCTRALVTVHGAKADIVDHTGQVVGGLRFES